MPSLNHHKSLQRGGRDTWIFLNRNQPLSAFKFVVDLYDAAVTVALINY